MGSYSDLNITIRRKDLTPITKEDLEKFERFFFEDFRDIRWREETCHPFICSDKQSIFASCTIKWTLERQDFQQFASENPHLQIEIMENSEHDGGTETRYLYEGDIFEVCDEVRYFEEPKKINWKHGSVERALTENKALNECIKKTGFFKWFGEALRNVFQDDCFTSYELGEAVSKALCQESVEEMFEAMTGWDIERIIWEWEQHKKYMEEK